MSIPSPSVFGWNGGPSTIVHWKMYIIILSPIGHSILGVAPLSFPMSTYDAQRFVILVYIYYNTCTKVSDGKDKSMHVPVDNVTVTM